MLEDQPSPHDDSHIVIISTTVGIIWTVLIFLIRLFIRLRIVGPFGLDDAAATLGTVRDPHNTRDDRKVTGPHF